MQVIRFFVKCVAILRNARENTSSADYCAIWRMDYTFFLISGRWRVDYL